MNKSFFKIQNKQNLLVSCCFSPGWNKQTKNSAKQLPHKHSEILTPPISLLLPRPLTNTLKKAPHRSIHKYTFTRRAPRIHGEKFTQTNQKKGCIWQRTILLVFFYWKKVKLRLVFSENLLLPRLRGTQRCWFCFVLRFFKQSGEISTQTYYTHWKKSLWAIVKHTNTTTTLAHTESDTKRVEHGTKGWNKSELEHVQDTNTETLSRVDTWDTYTLNNTNTTNIHTYIQTYTHMWH